jgi:hypothetical protein
VAQRGGQQVREPLDGRGVPRVLRAHSKDHPLQKFQPLALEHPRVGHALVLGAGQSPEARRAYDGNRVGRQHDETLPRTAPW